MGREDFSDDEATQDYRHLAKTRFGCVNGEEETPDPIPNSEAKLLSGNGTALIRVGE